MAERPSAPGHRPAGPLHRSSPAGSSPGSRRRSRRKALPALSIALVDDQRIVWARGFGFADRRADSVPATAETVYRVGSVSKLFTDLAVMQLVEQGRLDLDAPVSRVSARICPARTRSSVPITLRQLMSHRSGLVREPPVGHYFDPAPPSLDRRGAEPGEHDPGLRARDAHEVLERGRHRRGCGRRTRARASRSPRRSSARCSSRWGCRDRASSPGPELAAQLATGSMWTYDGQTIATPDVPARHRPGGQPRFVGDRPGPIPELPVRRRTRAGGRGRQAGDPAIDDRAPARQAGRVRRVRAGLCDLEARQTSAGSAMAGRSMASRPRSRPCPTPSSGAIVIATADCANGFASHVAETALRLMLAVRQGRPLPALETTEADPPRPSARARRARYAQRRQGHRSRRARRQALPELRSPGP